MARVAAIQMTSGLHLEKNLEKAAALIKQAAQQGASLAVLPENFALMGKNEHDKLSIREPFGQGAIQAFLAEQAQQNNIWLIGGTIPLAAKNSGKVRASCLAYDNQGQCKARYDKMHLFDVCVTPGVEQHQESHTIEAGDAITVLETPIGRLGLAVCYDIRFPELFRAMLQHQIEVIALPAAFTAKTGAAHWNVLTRARTIENFCFFIGACQSGMHENGRQTYGHSTIIHPWGNTLAVLAEGEGVVSAELNHHELKDLRRRFPGTQAPVISCVLLAAAGQSL